MGLLCGQSACGVLGRELRFLKFLNGCTPSQNTVARDIDWRLLGGVGNIPCPDPGGGYMVLLLD